MNKVSLSLAKGLLYLTQITPLAGRCSYSQISTRDDKNLQLFPQAITEAKDVWVIEKCFQNLKLIEFIADKDVLDLGSGYGGRTVEYAKYAKSVVGIEPFENMITSSCDYAKYMNTTNCSFKVCTEEIPLEDASVDVIFCYDVLEHVRDPRDTMSEIQRVLRPGGKAVVVFPPYFGAFSHHLDYISLFPALHIIFSPFTLVKASNDILKTQYGQKFGTALQPEPQKGYLKDRYVLPTLNGLTSAEFREMCKPFNVEEFHEEIYFSRKFPFVGKCFCIASKLFWGRLREMFCFKINVVLTKF